MKSQVPKRKSIDKRKPKSMTYNSYVDPSWHHTKIIDQGLNVYIQILKKEIC